MPKNSRDPVSFSIFCMRLKPQDRRRSKMQDQMRSFKLSREFFLWQNYLTILGTSRKFQLDQCRKMADDAHDISYKSTGIFRRSGHFLLQLHIQYILYWIKCLDRGRKPKKFGPQKERQYVIFIRRHQMHVIATHVGRKGSTPCRGEQLLWKVTSIRPETFVC
jgi:hypothetical protein